MLTTLPSISTSASPATTKYTRSPRSLVQKDGLARLEMLAPHLRRLEDAQLRHVARQEQVHRPVDENPNLAVPAGELAQVNAAPHEPGQEPRQLDAHHLGHRRAAAQRRQRAERLELVRLQLAAGERRDDVVRAQLALPHGVLRRRRRELPSFTSGTAAQSPMAHTFGAALAVESVGHGDLAACLRQGEARQQRMRLDRHGGDDRARADRAAAAARLVAYTAAVAVTAVSRVLTSILNAALHEHLVGELRQRRLHLRQNRLGALQQHERQLVGA